MYIHMYIHMYIYIYKSKKKSSSLHYISALILAICHALLIYSTKKLEY